MSILNKNQIAVMNQIASYGKSNGYIKPYVDYPTLEHILSMGA